MKEPMENREFFASFLRKSKKKNILEEKRRKLLYFDSSLLEVTPSDFLHIASSGVDFSSLFDGLVKYMNK